jgi:two-component sensor histidine kinase
MTFPASTGPMASAIRAFDWSSTSLGPIDGWPPELRVAVNLMLDSGFPKAIVWGADLVTLFNDAFRPILGKKRDPLGKSFAEIWAEAWDTVGPIAARAFAGQSTFIEDFPLEIERGNGMEQAWFTFSYSPIRGADGTVLGMMDTVVETTRAVNARETELMLRREMAHRVRNTLSVANVIAKSSLRHAASLEQAATAISNRFRALARAQKMGTEAEVAAKVGDVLRSVLAAYAEETSRIHMSGPDVYLDTPQVTAVSLVAYELATNAAKYGALATAEGEVTIEWSVDAERNFTFCWQERTPGVTSAPVHTGFGTQLATMFAPAYFAGEGEMHFLPQGARYVLRGKLNGIGAKG